MDCVVGTSMGAIVGGLYAAGYDATQIRDVLDHIDWKNMFSDDPSRAELPMRRKDEDFRYLLNFEVGFHDGHVVMPTGLIQGQKLLMLLRQARRLPLSGNERRRSAQLAASLVAAEGSATEVAGLEVEPPAGSKRRSR